MPIKFSCPECDNQMSVPDAFVGRKGKCTKCGADVQAPATTPEAESEAPATPATPPADDFAGMSLEEAAARPDTSVTRTTPQEDRSAGMAVPVGTGPAESSDEFREPTPAEIAHEWLVDKLWVALAVGVVASIIVVMKAGVAPVDVPLYARHEPSLDSMSLRLEGIRQAMAALSLTLVPYFWAWMLAMAPVYCGLVAFLTLLHGAVTRASSLATASGGKTWHVARTWIAANVNSYSVASLVGMAFANKLLAAKAVPDFEAMHWISPTLSAAMGIAAFLSLLWIGLVEFNAAPWTYGVSAKHGRGRRSGRRRR